MSDAILPIRLKAKERKAFEEASQKLGLSLSEFIRQAGREKAERLSRPFASLSVDPNYRMPSDASENPKAYIRQQIRRRHVVHR